MGWFRRLMGAKAKTAGQTVAEKTAASAQEQSQYIKSRRDELFSSLMGGSTPPWVTGLLGELGQGGGLEREDALEGGMRGGQLHQFLTEQPFRRRQNVSMLMSNLLNQANTDYGGALGLTGNAAMNAGQLGFNQQSRDIGLTASLLGGFGSLVGSYFTPGGIFGTGAEDSRSGFQNLFSKK